MKLSWNWLKDYVAVRKSPQEVAERLTMTGLEVKGVEKIGSDHLLETEVTSNRPDLLSHIGVAREIAAVCSTSFRLPPVWKNAPKRISQLRGVKVIDSDLCPYYSGVVVEGIQSVETPTWMKQRLEVCGIRSIHFLVDVTNYVLLEWGQPLHAFDLEKLKGNIITARRAKEGEGFVAIDNNSYALNSSDVVIADNGSAIALGGIMGGKNSEVSAKTSHILLESAYFSPAAIRKTARRLKLVSESSYRFERGVDPASVVNGRDRALYLIAQHAKVGAVSKPLISGKLQFKNRSVSFSFDQIGKTLGQVSISTKQAKAILNRLELRTEVQKGPRSVCNVPSFRSDISIPEDLIEEIARVYGYDKISETLPTLQPAMPVTDPLLVLSEQVKDECAAAGLHEVVTFSLVSPASYELLVSDRATWVQIENPRNQVLTLMRPSLIGNFLDVVKLNFSVGLTSVAIFEVGNRYLEAGKLLPDEERVLALGLVGNRPASYLDQKRLYDFSDVKGIVQDLISRSKRVSCKFLPSQNSLPFFERGHVDQVVVGETPLGLIGLIKPSLTQKMRVEAPMYYAELSLTKLVRIPTLPKKYQAISRFPVIERDLSLLVSEEVRVGDLLNEIQSLGRGLIRQIELFDLFRGGKLPANKKSVAFHIRYQSSERTLETKEVDELHFSIINTLNDKFQAELPPAKVK